MQTVASYLRVFSMQLAVLKTRDRSELKALERELLRFLMNQGQQTPTDSYAVVYYTDDGRQIYWPPDPRPEVVETKLREAREQGLLNARVSVTKQILDDYLPATNRAEPASSKQSGVTLGTNKTTINCTPMTNVNQCLILAAGNGTRLRPVSSGLPKPLVHFRGKAILEHVILRARQAGIDKFVIVVGYRSDVIRRWFDNRWRGKVSVTWVENPEYHKANGISVLKARRELHENFLLLMADHIFEPETAKVLMQQPVAPGEVILAVDPNIDRVFDLDDATKVRREGDLIVDIGKEIANYDALDTGMFLCSPVLFDRLESATRDGNCSLSDGMRQLARERSLRAFEIGEAQWQDVDTPAALAHAGTVFNGTYCYEPTLERLAS